MDIIKVRFLEDCEPKNDSGVKFKKGQEIDLPHASALHWIKRNKAIEVEAAPAKKQPEAEQKPVESEKASDKAKKDK